MSSSLDIASMPMISSSIVTDGPGDIISSVFTESITSLLSKNAENTISESTTSTHVLSVLPTTSSVVTIPENPAADMASTTEIEASESVSTSVTVLSTSESLAVSLDLASITDIEESVSVATTTTVPSPSESLTSDLTSTAEIGTYISVATTRPVVSLSSSQGPDINLTASSETPSTVTKIQSGVTAMSSSFDISFMPIISSSIVTDGSADTITSVSAASTTSETVANTISESSSSTLMFPLSSTTSYVPSISENPIASTTGIETSTFEAASTPVFLHDISQSSTKQPTASSPLSLSTMTTISTYANERSNTITGPPPSPTPSISANVTISTDVEEAIQNFSNFQQSIQPTLMATVSQQNASEYLNFLSGILDVFSNSTLPANNASSFGSRFLQLVDEIALSTSVEVGETVQFGTPNFNLTVQSIDTGTFNDSRLNHSLSLDSRSQLISLPNSLLSSIGQPDVKIVSVLYRNIPTVLVTNSSQMILGTPIVSSTLGCQNSTCNISSAYIEDGVITTFRHNNNGLEEGLCVFWDLVGDFWSRRGCYRVKEESNETHTTCFCDHLTHFAVLFVVNDLDIPGNTSVERALELFSDFEESLQASSMGTISEQRASEYLNFLSDILDIFSNSNLPDSNASSFGSRLLQLVDQIALSTFVEVGETVQLGTPNLNITVQNIDTGTFNDSRLEHSFSLDSHYHSILLPKSLFSSIGQPDVKIASVFYGNLSAILGTNSSQMKLGTPIVSSTLDCRNSNCTRSLASIGDGVVKTFSHNNSQSKENLCVFWDLDGDFWSRRGCFRMEEESNETHTTCFCDHLTHFAVLFDFGVGPPLSDEDILALEILSYIGYGITFVCLVAVIVIFVSFKPLWELRTYIHIHLCVNLLIALFITVFGMDKEKPYEKSRELCAATAVIGQYFYHVVFMWMLMEGVILYIKIVHVFGQENKKHYIIFTLLSYGLPLVYLFLSIPLGFFRRGDMWSYGADVTDSNSTDSSHHNICWLTTSDYFLFVFVVPVLLIVLINCGIFVIVMVIIAKKLRQSQDKNKIKNARTWLRSAFSLMVVLGIGWVIGLFVFHHVVYYVAVIYYGIQGILIFVLLILLSSKVRKTICKRLNTLLQQNSLSSDATSSSLRKNSVVTFLFGGINGSDKNSSNSRKSYSSKKKMHNGIELGTIGSFHENRLAVDLHSEGKQSNSSFQMDSTRGDKSKDQDLPPSDGKSLANTTETEIIQCTVDFN